MGAIKYKAKTSKSTLLTRVNNSKRQVKRAGGSSTGKTIGKRRTVEDVLLLSGRPELLERNKKDAIESIEQMQSWVKNNPDYIDTKLPDNINMYEVANTMQDRLNRKFSGANSEVFTSHLSDEELIATKGETALFGQFCFINYKGLMRYAKCPSDKAMLANLYSLLMSKVGVEELGYFYAIQREEMFGQECDEDREEDFFVEMYSHLPITEREAIARIDSLWNQKTYAVALENSQLPKRFIRKAKKFLWQHFNHPNVMLSDYDKESSTEEFSYSTGHLFSFWSEGVNASELIAFYNTYYGHMSGDSVGFCGIQRTSWRRQYSCKQWFKCFHDLFVEMQLKSEK